MPCICYCNSTSSTTGTTVYWPLWHNSTATNSAITAATFASNTIWPTWHQVVVQLTEEEYRALVEAQRQQELQHLEEIRRLSAEAEERNKLKQEAEKRAKAILIEHLTPEQQETVEKNKWFVVIGGKTGKPYRIRTSGYQGNVEQLENSTPKTRFCCHASHALPLSDHHLTQKMMIESDECEFLRVANRTHF
jgi:hypothetical protein